MSEVKNIRLGTGEDVSSLLRNPILQKHIGLLSTLIDEKLFVVFHDDKDGFYIEECCDNYFHEKLTKERCLELSELFKEIADQL